MWLSLVGLLALGPWTAAQQTKPPVDGGLYTAEELLKKCADIPEQAPPNQMEMVRIFREYGDCVGYLAGIADSAVQLRLGLYQTPEGATAEQLRKVFMKYANDHPQDLHRGAAIVVMRSFVAAWPKEEKTSPPGR